ncbi:MAG: phosphoesterase, partial [Spirochaetota bacterium]
LVNRLKAVRDEAFTRETSRLRQGGLIRAPHVQWFHVEDRFEPMGVKMIGVFCDLVKKMDFIDPRKYLAGFQAIPARVPGFGDIPMDQVKISMRVPPALENPIREGRIPGLDVLLPEATSRLGGFSDACHSLTAATTVQRGAEQRLIAELEGLLAGQ